MFQQLVKKRSTVRTGGWAVNFQGTESIMRISSPQVCHQVDTRTSNLTTRWSNQVSSLRTGFRLEAQTSAQTNCCSQTHSSHSSCSPLCCEGLQPAPLSDYTNAQEKSILLFFYTRRALILGVGQNKYKFFCSYEFAH